VWPASSNSPNLHQEKLMVIYLMHQSFHIPCEKVRRGKISSQFDRARIKKKRKRLRFIPWVQPKVDDDFGPKLWEQQQFPNKGDEMKNESSLCLYRRTLSMDRGGGHAMFVVRESEISSPSTGLARRRHEAKRSNVGAHGEWAAGSSVPP
jgi:hypothetical protein